MKQYLVLFTLIFNFSAYAQLGIPQIVTDIGANASLSTLTTTQTTALAIQKAVDSAVGYVKQAQSIVNTAQTTARMAKGLTSGDLEKTVNAIQHGINAMNSFNTSFKGIIDDKTLASINSFTKQIDYSNDILKKTITLSKDVGNTSTQIGSLIGSTEGFVGQSQLTNTALQSIQSNLELSKSLMLSTMQDTVNQRTITQSREDENQAKLDKFLGRNPETGRYNTYNFSLPMNEVVKAKQIRDIR